LTGDPGDQLRRSPEVIHLCSAEVIHLQIREWLPWRRL
jgi:hypothetical protein